MESNNLGRRRGPGFVTPNACTECRKRRTKCDGEQPCSRCKTHGGFECVYEVPTRTSKEEMRKEISQLRSRQHQFEQVFAALASQEGSDQILRQIQNGDTLGTIRNRLRSLSSSLAPIENVTTYPQFGNRQAISHALEAAESAGIMQFTTHPSTNAFQMASQNQPVDLPQPWNVQPGADILSNELLNSTSHLDPMNWEFNPAQSSSSSHPLVGVWHEQPMNPEFSSIIESARARGQDVILGDTTKSGKVPDNDDSKYQRKHWTTVTSDRELVEHLLALYFCWEYPVFATLSKNHFMKDFRAGSTNYCSSLLVNALLALACRFSDRPSARADPDDNATAGAHFFAEALKLFLEEEDHRVLTTIQALGIMSIREASRGRVHESIFFCGQSMRLAIEMGLHLDAENTGDDEGGNDEAEDEDKAVREATFWGAFSLDEAWSLCTGNLPHFSRKINLVTKPAILRLIESASWIPYRDDGGPLEQNCVQPSNIRSVYKTFCELSEIIHRTLYTFYSPGSSITSKALLETYSQYIHWYDTIPDTLRLGHNFTPAVLFSHLYYHFAILLLFRPFVKYSIIGSDVSPKQICNQASRAISAVIKSYSELYSLRRTPSFVPYFVLPSTILHLASVQDDESNIVSKAQLSQSLADLNKMSSCHGFAAQALEIVRFLGNMWGVDGDFRDTFTGRTLQHLSQECLVGVDQLRPIIGDLSMMQYIQAKLSVDKGGNSAASFHMKGLPLVATGEQLEVDGFRLLESPRQV